MTTRPTGVASRANPRITDMAALVVNTATPSAASTATGTAGFDEVAWSGSLMRR